MNKRKSIVFDIISALVGFGLFLAIVLTNNFTVGKNIFVCCLWILLGAIFWFVIITFVHELGHLISGKINGFAFVSLSVMCFRWKKVGKEVLFSFCKPTEEAGYTELVPKYSDQLKERFTKVTASGYSTSLILVVLGAIPLIIDVPSTIFCLTCTLLPLTVYMVLDSVLPKISGSIRNDGGVIKSLKMDDDWSKVLLSILTIQSELYNGKTYSEIDKSLYFDLPQLCEDDVNFINLLLLRYYYYLDVSDYDNAKKTIKRLKSLVDYMPDSFYYHISAEELYSKCTFDYDEDLADELMYELEDYLNNNNTVENVRTKLAYLENGVKENDDLTDFYNKFTREAKRLVLSGQKEFELKLIKSIKK